MRPFKVIAMSVLAAASTMVLIESPVAQDGAALVKQRKSDMSHMGKSFAPIIPIVRGESQKASDAIAALTTLNRLAKKIIANFPPGTGRDAVPTTRAKPDVWTKRAEFEAAAKQLVEASGSLLDAAKSNDVQAFRVRFQALAKACGGCHRARGREGGKFRFAKE